MFDRFVSAAQSTALGAAAAAWARVENAACARRLAAMADMLEHQHAQDGSADREQWCFDNWNTVACQIGAAYGVTLGVASHQLLVAMALRERLPRLDEVFHAGQVAFRTVETIVYRTGLVTDPDIQSKIDVEIAAVVAAWGRLSQTQLERAIDAWVERLDPEALRRVESKSRFRRVDTHCDGRGMATIEAVLFAHDAVALDRRLDAMAATVCQGDPRTLDQRRSDALGVLGQGGDRLACGCGDEQCAAAGEQASAVVINVIAEEQTLADDTPAVLDGQDPDKPTKPLTEMTWNEVVARPPAKGPAHTPPAVLIGGPILPAPLLAAKIAAAGGAKIRYIHHPGDTPPEPGYRPSAGLARFIRCRDITCRFPGCSEPADVCEIDHTIAYPVGPTCASNLKCLCKKHHLAKTFGGWRDRQHPDGTVDWTDPHGNTTTTRPGAYGLFPTLCQPTAPAHPNPEAAPDNQDGRDKAAPRRRRTRAQNRAARIQTLRRNNSQLAAQIIAERNKPPPF